MNKPHDKINDNDLVQKAREFATNAHTRIDHRRKYSKQPYSTHLAAVAKIVESVTDDAETIAAAWLHDVVEDTTATLYDIEQEFGARTASLVSQLTDVSKPSDGNRATRKEMDRQHLANASAKAQTVKLADLIDNSRDICKNDPRFSVVYLKEMQALLEVLTNGHIDLLHQAKKTHQRCLEKIAKQNTKVELPAINEHAAHHFSTDSHSHMYRLFSNAFTAQDIAEAVRSFDADKTCQNIAEIMDFHEESIVCIRNMGKIQGYVRRSDLSTGKCGEHIRFFRHDQVLSGDASLSDIVHTLTLHQYGFITTLGDISGYFSRSDINKPVVRMWLFGIITFIEMEFMNMIEECYPKDSWQPFVSEGRLQKAIEMKQERKRRNQDCKLLECLQLSDKGQILIQDDEILQQLGMESRRNARKLIRELESLRNNLAHAQDIVTHDWAPIVRLSYRLEETLSIKKSI